MSVQGVSQVHMRDFPPGLDLGQTNLHHKILFKASDLSGIGKLNPRNHAFLDRQIKLAA